MTNKSVDLMQNSAKEDYLYFYQICSLHLFTLGAFKIVIFISTSLKLSSLNQTLYIAFKNGLNFIRVYRCLFSICFETPCILLDLHINKQLLHLSISLYRISNSPIGFPNCNRPSKRPESLYSKSCFFIK